MRKYRIIKHTFNDIIGYIDIDTLEDIYGKCFSELEIRKLQYHSEDIFPDFDWEDIQFKIEGWLEDEETIIHQINEVLKEGLSVDDYMNVYHPKSVK